VVVDTKEISKLPKPKALYKSKRGTVLVGFDENFGSNIEEISGEYEVYDEVTAQIDDIEGERPVVYKTTAKYNQTKTSLKIFNKKIIANYDQYKTKLVAKFNSIKTGVESYSAGFKANVSVRGRVFASDTGISGSYGVVRITPTTTYRRSNIVFTATGSNEGFGKGWIEQLNDKSKYTSVFNQFGKSRSDGFYKKYNFFYANADDYNLNIYSSSSLSDAEYVNSETLPIGVQNHRFAGSKLVGKNLEGINDIPIPAVTPDGGPIVEVNVVSELSNRLIGIKKYTSLVKKD
jgi:hypothetical protein